YFADLLNAIGAGNLDGLVLHTYSHGSSPSLITSEEKMADPRFSKYHYHFRAYRDFMAVIPAAMRSLPLYITESNQGDQPWENANTGWVRAAYAEIDAWNRANSQRIRSLLLYRWPQVPGDRWGIEGKAGVIEDFRQALGPRYQWTTAEDPLVALARRVAELEQAAAALKPQIDSLNKLAADVLALRKDAEALAGQVNAAKLGDLRQRLDALAAQIKALEDGLKQPVPPPAGPAMVDKIGKLAQGPTPYPRRDLGSLRRVVVHHTVTPGNITPERLAQAAVQRGLPGITYHYLITGDGTIYATQPLDALISQTNKAGVNADSIGVALAGNFTNTVPTEAQMTAAAALISYLLGRFNLPISAVVGAREVSQTASPGNQWLSGAKYKEALLARINLPVTPKGDDTDLLLLQQKIEELQNQVTALNGQVSALNGQLAAMTGQRDQLQGQLNQALAQNSALQQQVNTLQPRVAELEATVKSQAAEIERLRGLLADRTTGRVAKPPVVDKVDQLAHHPTLPPYGKRTRPISMIVVHHTDTPKTMTVEKIAEYHVFGERKDAKGNVIKAQWPGIGYHFLIGPDGVITQGQRESTRSYHVGGDPNDYSVAISLIGRFMRKNYDGTDRAPEDQEPAPQQLESAGQLAAWLMQEYAVPLEQVKGHRDVWPQSTVCPGEHWKAGLNWYPKLVREIQAAQAAAGGQAAKPVPLYLLFWDHGAAWAEADWGSAQGYIARFRPTTGFSVGDALLAERVVIVGGPAGVSGQDEARLRAAGAEVYRLSGKDEADTKRMLDELAQRGTPWPGAPVQAVAPRDMAAQEGLGGLDRVPQDGVMFPDEWTIPDDWQMPEAAYPKGQPRQPEPAYPKEIGDLFVSRAESARAPVIPKVFTPVPGEGQSDEPVGGGLK
ncbi:MAG: N-acetylmuramoyl-L-alanine amidase, partial [Nitrososphaerales archaeon]